MSGQTVTPANITFTNQSTDADSFAWDFGDGRTSSEVNPVVIFNSAETFTITLVAVQTSTSKSDTALKSLTITTPAPIADFTMSGQTVTPANITFNNRSTNADRFQWDFGDGRTSIQENPVMMFNLHGSFTVMLVAIQSSTSRSDTIHKTLTITPGKVYLETVFVDQIPFTMPNGSAWDNNGTTPDLQWDFLDPSSNTILYTLTIDDVLPSDFPIRWTLNNPYQVNNWSGTYQFKLYDDDWPFGSELMGSVSCRINSLVSSSGYTQSYSLTGASGTIRLRIEVRWE